MNAGFIQNAAHHGILRLQQRQGLVSQKDGADPLSRQWFGEVPGHTHGMTDKIIVSPDSNGNPEPSLLKALKFQQDFEILTVLEPDRLLIPVQYDRADPYGCILGTAVPFALVFL